ncbi:MAG: tRNA epoxyqueuosine(34) reductase QueG [Phycisphaerae bacterium]|jgi:epoxyqueuosine reductase
MASPDNLAEQIKALALQAGFDAVGIAAAGPVAPQQAATLNQWLAAGCCGEMSYMRRNLDKRLCPQKLVEGTASVICLAARCGAAGEREEPVAAFARGKDYHKFLKKKCIALMDRIRVDQPQFVGRAFVDSAPVMERSLAAASGLGWVGRNGCLFVPGAGSFVLLCEILCNLSLAADSPLRAGCDGCDACIRACPTGAISPRGWVDARRCISYHTIENRGRVPAELWEKFGVRLFGCDACQRACPHNRGLPAPVGGMFEQAAAPLDLAEVLAWTPENWDRRTRGSALRRAGYEMFLRNAVIAAGNSGRGELAALLGKLESRDDLGPLVRWAIDRLR